jgi:hypothetical protein
MEPCPWLSRGLQDAALDPIADRVLMDRQAASSFADCKELRSGQVNIHDCIVHGVLPIVYYAAVRLEREQTRRRSSWSIETTSVIDRALAGWITVFALAVGHGTGLDTLVADILRRI